MTSVMRRKTEQFFQAENLTLLPDIADECGQMRAPDIDPAMLLRQERQHGGAAAHDSEGRGESGFEGSEGARGER